MKEADMRKVIFSEYVQNQYTGMWDLRETGEATFHQFGVDYEEFETGLGNFSTAIIELPDGTVKNVPVHHIRFKDPK